MDIVSFFNTYFAQPLCNPTGGYNIYNTLAYGLLTAFVAFGLYWLFSRMKVRIDGYFFAGAAPYVVLGSFWHVYEDATLGCIPWLEAPIIYLMFAAIAIVALIAGIFIEKRISSKLKYWQFMLIVAGISVLVSAFSFFKIIQPLAGLKILGLTAVFLAVFALLSKKWPVFFTPMNICVLTTAMFDAASTAVGMSSYGYFEKHVLPTFLINLAGTAWVMIPLKLVVVFGALYIIDKLNEDTQFSNMVKFAILVVTLGPGSRNLLRIVMGV